MTLRSEALLGGRLASNRGNDVIWVVDAGDQTTSLGNDPEDVQLCYLELLR